MACTQYIDIFCGTFKRNKCKASVSLLFCTLTLENQVQLVLRNLSKNYTDKHGKINFKTMRNSLKVLKCELGIFFVMNLLKKVLEYENY